MENKQELVYSTHYDHEHLTEKELLKIGFNLAALIVTLTISLFIPQIPSFFPLFLKEDEDRSAR